MVVALAAPGSAAADDLLSERLSVSDAVDRTCTERSLSGASGTDQRSVTAPATGWIVARLEGDGPGDWDLGVFDADSGRAVAGSASFGTKEVAQGFVTQGQHLTVQACRRSGGAGANLAVSSTAVDTKAVEPPQLVNVSTPNAARKSELQSLGLDLTEAGGPKALVVVLHGAKDAQKLRDHKFTYTVVVKDLAARDARDRAADQQFSRDVSASDFPSGRTTYRHLADYQNDLKQLARTNPDLVKPIACPRDLERPRGRRDRDHRRRRGQRRQARLPAHGRPPRARVAVGRARDGVRLRAAQGYSDGDARARRLVRDTRTIVIPIVNPDGFNTSREAGELRRRGDGRDAATTTGEQLSRRFTYEYRRKNCRCPTLGGRRLQRSADPASSESASTRTATTAASGAARARAPTCSTQNYRGAGPVLRARDARTSASSSRRAR